MASPATATKVHAKHGSNQTRLRPEQTVSKEYRIIYLPSCLYLPLFRLQSLSGKPHLLPPCLQLLLPYFLGLFECFPPCLNLRRLVLHHLVLPFWVTNEKNGTRYLIMYTTSTHQHDSRKKSATEKNQKGTTPLLQFHDFFRHNMHVTHCQHRGQSDEVVACRPFSHCREHDDDDGNAGRGIAVLRMKRRRTPPPARPGNAA